MAVYESVYGEQVSTARGSGQVSGRRSQNPPATAGGTDLYT